MRRRLGYLWEAMGDLMYGPALHVVWIALCILSGWVAVMVLKEAGCL